ncbi:MAG: glycosyltransferase family protein [Anaerolineae bacterium]|nr:glycosyltransferase family protein [Anaerolineae bacterium]
MLKTIAIIQARMSSSRLPGKVLLPIGERTMLAWVVERTRRAATIDDVFVATTTDPSDDPVAEFCKAQGYRGTRGSIHDVLDRYYHTAKAARADVVVRITADCPLIDPVLVDDAVNTLIGGRTSTPRFDFVANRLPEPWGRTYPIGLDTEVFTFEALEKAWKRALLKHQREHVTAFFYDETPVEYLRPRVDNAPFSSGMTPDGMQIALLHHQPDYGHQRWTVDTPEDLELIRRIVARFPNDRFAWKDVLALVESEPQLMQINAQIKHKTHLDVDERTQ